MTAAPVDLGAVAVVDPDATDPGAELDLGADEAGPADPLDDSTITPPGVSEDDLEI